MYIGEKFVKFLPNNWVFKQTLYCKWKKICTNCKIEGILFDTELKLIDKQIRRLEKLKNGFHNFWAKKYNEKRRIYDRNTIRTWTSFSFISQTVPKKQKHDWLACTHEFLKKLLPSQVIEDMTLEIHGSVGQINHSSLCSNFVVSDETQMRKCYNWNNWSPTLLKNRAARGNCPVSECTSYNKLRLINISNWNYLIGKNYTFTVGILHFLEHRWSIFYQSWTSKDLFFLQ